MGRLPQEVEYTIDHTQPLQHPHLIHVVVSIYPLQPTPQQEAMYQHL